MKEKNQEEIDKYMREFEDYLLKQIHNNHDYSEEQKKIHEQINKYMKEFNDYLKKENKE
jgi:ABC-type transporter MlaC component